MIMDLLYAHAFIMSCDQVNFYSIYFIEVQ